MRLERIIDTALPLIGTQLHSNEGDATIDDLHVPGKDPQSTTVARAADAVVDAIQAEINAGRIKEGDRLPTERDLMARFDVSRTVIREAIRSLSSQGLVESRPRYRPVVKKLGVDSAMEAMESVVLQLLSQPGGVRNLFETRVLIEAGLVREAAASASKDDINALKTALDFNRTAINDSEEFYKTDVGFHLVLYQISRNPVLPAIHKAYTSWLAPHWSRMPPLQDRNQRNFEAHLAIFEAILMRDPDAAEAELRSHLKDAWEQVRLTFGEG